MTSLSEENLDNLREKDCEGDETHDSVGDVAERNDTQAQEWEKMAMAWVSAFPEARSVARPEVESWVDANITSLPADLQSMPRSDLIERLISIQGYLRPPEPPQALEAADDEEDDELIQEEEHSHHARFQRTDRWLPIYTWLESLNTNEVVKSKDISEWLSRNPIVGGRLCSRHSKYHLFHYIKKCHIKILKRREKKKTSVSKEQSLLILGSIILQGLLQIDSISYSPTVAKSEDTVEMTVSRDSGTYLMKREEALGRYKLLMALEKKLSPLFSKAPD